MIRRRIRRRKRRRKKWRRRKKRGSRRRRWRSRWRMRWRRRRRRRRWRRWRRRKRRRRKCEEQVVSPHHWTNQAPAHAWAFLRLLPNALEPTLVGTKLLLPMPPDRLRKSARRWVTQVAVLQARFCAVTLLQERKTGVNRAPLTCRPPCHMDKIKGVHTHR